MPGTTISKHFLNISRDYDSAASMGSLMFQILTTPWEKKSFLIPNLNLPWCNLRPFPVILLLKSVSDIIAVCDFIKKELRKEKKQYYRWQQHQQTDQPISLTMKIGWERSWSSLPTGELREGQKKQTCFIVTHHYLWKWLGHCWMCLHLDSQSRPAFCLSTS